RRRRPPSSTLFPYTTLFRSERRSPDWLLRTVSRPAPVWARQVHPKKRRAVPALKLHRHRRAVSAPELRRLRRTPTIQGTHSAMRSEEHTSELQSLRHLVCRL